MTAVIRRVTSNLGCHVVQFYGNDQELIERVVDYLADGIADGDVVVVVATETHRRAFDASLSAGGVDVAAARAKGCYLVLDAETTMSQFLVSDWPEPAAFEATVGALIRQALQTGRAVRAYGEMVALLWDAGHVNAAIELEVLWNALASQLPFSLFCAYPSQAVAGGDHPDSFTEVCRLHSAIVGQPANGAVKRRGHEGHCQDQWVTIVGPSARATDASRPSVTARWWCRLPRRARLRRHRGAD